VGRARRRQPPVLDPLVGLGQPAVQFRGLGAVEVHPRDLRVPREQPTEVVDRQAFRLDRRVRAAGARHARNTSHRATPADCSAASRISYGAAASNPKSSPVIGQNAFRGLP
jgi:hypothetical protein